MDIKNIKNVQELDRFLDEKIEENRKGSFDLKVLDHLGEPLKDVEVSVEHINHDFVFGVCPNGHISMTNELACGNGEDSEKYWKLIGDLFNGTTLWWAWEVLEPVEGKWTFDEKVGKYGPMNRMVERAEKLGHKLTAHAILYPNTDVTPAWVQTREPKEAVKYFERHVRSTAERYKSRINFWHPVNEAYRPLQTIGNLQVNEGLVYRWIREEIPNAGLVDNGGYTINPDFYAKGIRNAKAFETDVDYLGIRGYFELYRPDALDFFKDLWEHFGNLKKLYGKKIRFTELGASSAKRAAEHKEDIDVDHTIIAQLGITDIATDESKIELSEETQAEFLTRMYKLMFAHEAMYECTYWDMVDKYTWNEVEGGLVKNDLTPKLAYYKIQELIHKQWNTKLSLKTDSDGRCNFKGFYGTYKIKANGKEVSIDFTKDMPSNAAAIY